MGAPGAEPGSDPDTAAAGSGRRVSDAVKRAAAALLFLGGAAALFGLPDSAGREAHTALGVSLTISAGCNVVTKPAGVPVQNGGGSAEQRIAVSVSCTNDVPYQIGIYGGTETVMPADPAPQVALAPGMRFDAVSLIVTY
jgi:hypothetical protein